MAPETTQDSEVTAFALSGEKFALQDTWLLDVMITDETTCWVGNGLITEKLRVEVEALNVSSVTTKILVPVDLPET